MGFDVVIRGGTVVDGTGAPPVKADIGISDDGITARKDVEVQGPTNIWLERGAQQDEGQEG